jgi:hypothetical protein
VVQASASESLQKKNLGTDSIFEAEMSRRTSFLLTGFYLLAAAGFSAFHVVTNPFSTGLNADVMGNALGGTLLLFGSAGFFPLLGWAFYRFKSKYAMWPMLSWAFLGVALAWFVEIGVRLERDVQISILARNLAQSDAKLSCLDSQHANKFKSEVGITDREVALYCSCVSEATAASVTADELTYIAANGKAPQPVQERAVQLGQSCRRLFGVKTNVR